MLESLKEDYILSNKKSWDEAAPRFFWKEFATCIRFISAH